MICTRKVPISFLGRIVSIVWKIVPWSGKLREDCTMLLFSKPSETSGLKIKFHWEKKLRVFSNQSNKGVRFLTVYFASSSVERPMERGYCVAAQR